MTRIALEAGLDELGAGALADARTQPVADTPVVSGPTPGPWMVERSLYNLWVGPEKAVGDKISDIVVSLDYGLDYRPEFYARQEANARLIAAAPELLEALCESAVTLRMLKRNIETAIARHDGLYRWEGVPEAVQARINQCEAAIAKATSASAGGTESEARSAHK